MESKEKLKNILMILEMVKFAIELFKETELENQFKELENKVIMYKEDYCKKLFGF